MQTATAIYDGEGVGRIIQDADEVELPSDLKAMFEANSDAQMIEASRNAVVEEWSKLSEDEKQEGLSALN